MYKAVILPLAQLDIAEAADWYNTKQKGLGKRFTAEVRATVLFMRENPLTSAVRYDDTHCAVLDAFLVKILLSPTLNEESLIFVNI